jgi:hypothetical protein
MSKRKANSGKWFVFAAVGIFYLLVISSFAAAQTLHPLGLIISPNTPSAQPVVGTLPPGGATLPAVLDYRNFNGGENVVTPVTDQGQCGSCWAFGPTATLETQVFVNTLMSTDESEQILVSCSGAGSCAGGRIDLASDFIKSTGLPPESYFPYTATDNSCSNAESGWQNATRKIGGWVWVTGTSSGNGVDALKNSLYNYGPLVTTMAVYNDFDYYTGGVYSHTWGNLTGYHAIELIGYDNNNQCFIVKNSWGTGWGESGVFRIAYSQVNNEVAFGRVGGTIAYTGSFLQDATATGGGWYYLNWFGNFYQDPTSQWIYHGTLGWLYPYASSTSAMSGSNVWFWDAQWDGKGGFWWTNATTYPWLYSSTEQAWLWFNAAASTPGTRWFYNTNTQKWETH